MKVGIVTLQEADNYGAVFQAYALQTALEHLGAESEFLVFQQEAKSGNATVKKTDKISISLVKRIKEETEKRSALFEDFRKSFLKRSSPIPIQNAKELNEVYDLFIAGSDQIWNFSIPEVDVRYFLPFSRPEKRFSYAASFGANPIPDNMKEWCREQLGYFRGLSVREEKGKETLEALIGRDSVVCLDPVFLLDRTEWDKLTFNPEAKPYILLYFMQYHKETAVYAQKLASERGLEIRIITGNFMYPCGFEAWSGTNVTTWLSYVKHAEYIFTNSFHGIAFSMIFERPFSVIPLGKHLSGRNERMHELLSKTGMEKCINGEPASIYSQELKERLGRLTQISYDYLKEALSMSCE